MTNTCTVLDLRKVCDFKRTSFNRTWTALYVSRQNVDQKVSGQEDEGIQTTMTKKVLIQSRELELAAERAGGFVAAPETLEVNATKEQEFTTIRRYSLTNNIPVSRLTKSDYKNMGITPQPPVYDE